MESTEESMKSTEESLLSFIKENFLLGRSDVNLAPEQSLLESGIIDSTGVMELVTFIEDEYSVKIEVEELIPENLDSVDNITKLLKTKGVK